MESPIKIAIVEDELIIAAKTSMELHNLGYEVTGVVSSGDEAISHIRDKMPDLVLLDVHLKGKMDGIDTAKEVKRIFDTAIIFVTANGDEATFNRAKETKPAAFICKPFNPVELQRAIELAICRMVPENQQLTNPSHIEENPIILSDRIFIRYRDKMIKIMVEDILYIEADRNYSRIFTDAKEYLLSLTLKTIEEKLPSRFFARIHRSYIINISKIDEVAIGYVLIGDKSIPLSGSLKDNLMERIQTL